MLLLYRVCGARELTDFGLLHSCLQCANREDGVVCLRLRYAGRTQAPDAQPMFLPQAEVSTAIDTVQKDIVDFTRRESTQHSSQFLF